MSMQAARYRWSELPTDHPMETISRRRVIGQQAMISHVKLEAGTHVPTHAHENEQFAVVLQGKGRFGLGETGSASSRDVAVQEGEVVFLPAGLPHSFQAITDCLILDIFSPPSATTGIDRA